MSEVMQLTEVERRVEAYIEEQAQLEIGRVFEELRVVDRFEAQLVAGVRGVRDQLAQEDFLVRVQRMRDEVQDLLDLGLE